MRKEARGRILQNSDAVGMDPKALRRVEALFWAQIQQRVHPGAALAVYRYGRPVVDLYGGVADLEAAKPVTRDTMFVLYSATKPLAAACVYILWERGKVKWDDPIAGCWPEFAQNGKAGITARHVLTHQAGFPDTPSELTWDRWRDWDGVVRAMEEVTPCYAPGEVIAYHPRNFGWVIGELVRRVDGRPFQQFLQAELTGPLGMHDTYVGMPEHLEERVSKEHAMDDCDRPAMVSTYNRPEVHRAVHPAGGGIATARDMAKFYAMMAGGGTLNGTRILAPETVEEVTGLQVEGMDHTLERHVRRSLGLALADHRMGAPESVTTRSFGHAGAGTSVCWADADSELAVAYITNGFRAESSNGQRLAAISQAVRDACC